MIYVNAHINSTSHARGQGGAVLILDGEIQFKMQFTCYWVRLVLG